MQLTPSDCQHIQIYMQLYSTGSIHTCIVMCMFTISALILHAVVLLFIILTQYYLGDVFYVGSYSYTVLVSVDCQLKVA